MTFKMQFNLAQTEKYVCKIVLIDALPFYQLIIQANRRIGASNPDKYLTLGMVQCVGRYPLRGQCSLLGRLMVSEWGVCPPSSQQYGGAPSTPDPPTEHCTIIVQT